MSHMESDDVERFSARTTLGETTAMSEVRPVGLRRTTSERHDRIRWGPIVSGAVVAVSTYLLLELLLLAAGALERDGGDIAGLPDGAWWSLVAAVVAFFLGGLVAAASMASRGADDGFLHGIVVWALATVVFLVLAVIGKDLALGTIGHALNRLDLDNQVQASGDDFTDAAGRAALALGATALVAGIGGVVGAKLWPRRERDALRFDDADVRRSGRTLPDE